VRRNFGYQSNDYGDPAILGSHRIGVTDGLTLGGRAAWSSSARLAAATLELAAGTRGTMSATLGMSDSPAGKGEAFSLRYRYLSQRLRIMARAVGTSAAFQPIEDMSARRLNPQAQIVLAADWSGTGRGSMGITLIRQRYHDKTERKLITLNYRRTFLGEIAVSAFLTRALGPATDLSLGINVSRPLGGGRNLSALALRTRAGSRLRMETQRSLPLGPGFGYRMGTVMGDDRTFDAALVGQTDYGRYRIEADTVGDETSWQASASGSVAWLADRPYLTREISDGFAVARVGNLENVRVYLENQEIGRSDASGRVLLPRLRPYEINRISIDPLDLPLTADVPFVSIDVAPAYGSGVTVEFPVQLTYSALARAVSPDGEPLPEGARVNVSGQTEPSVIGIDGKLFLNSRNASIEATAGLGSERCGFRVDLPAAARTLAQLGDIVCEPMP
jgi:outer membrane usher protein